MLPSLQIFVPSYIQAPLHRRLACAMQMRRHSGPNHRDAVGGTSFQVSHVELLQVFKQLDVVHGQLLIIALGLGQLSA